MQALPSFSFSGIEDYATRALTNPGGLAIIASPREGSESVRAVLDYYHTHHLGVDDVIEIKVGSDGDLYPAIKCSLEIQRMMRKYVLDHGARIEFFNTRNGAEEKLTNALGLNWQAHTASIPSKIADIGNNKAAVRRIAALLGKPELFPSHSIVSGTSHGEVADMFSKMVKVHPEVVLKRTSWASGLGMVFGNGTDVLQKFLTENSGYIDDVIIEQSLGDHVSMTIVKRFEKGREIDCWFSEQWCPRKAGHIVHEGSVLGNLPTVTSEDRHWMLEATAPLYRYFLEQASNLTGIVNWDCGRETQTGKRYIFEGNFRVTFSTYIREIQLALAKARGINPNRLTCIMRKTHPMRCRTFSALKDELGETLLSSVLGRGVIPIVTRCLERSGYCYLVAVGPNFLEAKAILDGAIEKIER